MSLGNISVPCAITVEKITSTLCNMVVVMALYYRVRVEEKKFE